MNCANCGQPAYPLPIKIDLTNNLLTANGQSVKVTPDQACIAEVLLNRYPNHVHTEVLFQSIYGARLDIPNKDTLKVQVSNLRTKLRPLGYSISCWKREGYKVQELET